MKKLLVALCTLSLPYICAYFTDGKKCTQLANDTQKCEVVFRGTHGYIFGFALAFLLICLIFRNQLGGYCAWLMMAIDLPPLLSFVFGITDIKQVTVGSITTLHHNWSKGGLAVGLIMSTYILVLIHRRYGLVKEDDYE